MSNQQIHQCQCENCHQGYNAHEKEIHHQIKVVMSRLDEQQRRWYAAVEANRHGHGGIKLVSQITGLAEKTIRQGQKELSLDLADRPEDRIVCRVQVGHMPKKRPDHRKGTDGFGRP